MKVKSESEVAQSCPNPSDQIDCSLPGSSVHGIFQARVLEWGAIAFCFYYIPNQMVEVSSVSALLTCSLSKVYPLVCFLFFFSVFFFLCGSHLIEVRQRNIKVELISVNTNQYLLI